MPFVTSTPRREVEGDSKKDRNDLRDFSVFAIRKSILFAVLATHSARRENFIEAIIEAYYAMFHMACTLIALNRGAARNRSGKKRARKPMESGRKHWSVRKHMLNALLKEKKDPLSTVSHRDAIGFIRSLGGQYKELAVFARNIGRAHGLRDQVNYAPRGEKDSSGTLLENQYFTEGTAWKNRLGRKEHPRIQEVRELVDWLETHAFQDFCKWLSMRWPQREGRLSVNIRWLLEDASDYFRGNRCFYKGWVPHNILDDARRFTDATIKTLKEPGTSTTQ